MTTFIKTEEQNYSLYNYVNMLNSEIDTIDEQNRHITEAIQRHERVSSMSAKDKEALKARLRGQIEDIRRLTKEKEAHIAQVAKALQQSQVSAAAMIKAFRASSFELKVAKPMIYDEETQFKEHNTTLYLAELEEYISMLITYTAYSQELPDAAVSALSLDKMLPKTDDGPLNVRINLNLTQQIDVPNANDTAWQQIDEAETNEEDTAQAGMCTNGRDLFRKFEELVARDQLKLGGSSKAK